MTVTEIGAMGVKPNMNIMDHTTPEGKILTDAWKTVISKPGGPQRVYWGLESVDPSKIWGFFDFDSVEQHRRFAEEYGADAVKDIPKICTYGEFSKHIKMVPSSDVLQSPLTEIILAYFPQDISDGKKETLSSKIQEILRQALPDYARVAHAWGVENDFPARNPTEFSFQTAEISTSVRVISIPIFHEQGIQNPQPLEPIPKTPSLRLYSGMAEKVTMPAGVFDQEHDAPLKPSSFNQKELVRNRPACFSNLSSELGFIFAVVDASNEARTWPAAAINFTTAVLILPFARLSEIYGGRLLFLGGHACSIVWSVITGFSQNPTILIACRAMQCLGSSAFLPSSVVIMIRIYHPGPRNTLIFGISGASSCIGFYSGIFFGALSAQVLSWKWYFFIGAFFCVGLAFVAFALTDIGTSLQGYVALILGIMCLVLFVYIEGWRASQPLVPAEFFKTGGFILALVGGFALHILNGRRLLIISCLGLLGASSLFSAIPDSGVLNSFLYWAFVFPAMILAIVGVDITFNTHNFIITTSLPNHLQAVAGALITSLPYPGMAFWLSVVEMATSAQKEKRTESLDATNQCQIGFWTGTGLTLIFIMVQIQSAEADATADEKAQREWEKDVRQNV
ncbi:major facilitator family transporter [Fusarium denticulatum]|uniref:Major facilitator family transporter n=1 Tax=Fusarium denticulatum TaxID=48507 RepID=A0A8H5XJ86_9HYPO|nr:major facilitator family transporter [Fusarium denticulatum]